MHSGCGQMISDGVSLLALGLPREAAFQPENHGSPYFLFFGGSLAPFNNLPGKIRLTTANKAQAENGDPSTIPACNIDRSKACHSHACPNLSVPRAETAALLINSWEQGNGMQTLSTGDFFTKGRKYLWYNTHCLQALAYHSPCEAVNLWKTIIEGKFCGNYVHTQSWLGSNQIYSSASSSLQEELFFRKLSIVRNSFSVGRISVPDSHNHFTMKHLIITMKLYVLVDRVL